jgi:hypothetical protein
MTDNNLKHYGVLGMRWGHRKAGGARTVSVGRGPLGAIKEVAGLSKDAIKDDINKIRSIGAKKPTIVHPDSAMVKTLQKKKVDELSNDEIRKITTRLQLEKQLKDLTPKKVNRGNKFVGTLLKGIGSDLLKEFLRRRTPTNMDDVFKAGRHNRQQSAPDNVVEGQVVG